ncbi:MAG: hemolysin [Flavobacteriales bacterium]|nr:hemolysin [Flavobacteriales bacterium]
MTALFFYLFIALFVSFVCSLAESVLLSVPQSYLATIKDKYPWADSFLSYKQKIDKPLSAILALNTVAHTIGAAGVGAEASKIFGRPSLGIVSAILTLLILILSEIIPKTLGALYCKNLSKLTFYSIKFMMILTYPLVIISIGITQLFAKKNNQIISREEFSAMANLGYNEGVFSKDENRIIQNILNLKKIKVSEILTPRVVVVSANENLSIVDFKSQKKYLNFSRIPLFSDQNEKITGYILLQDVLKNNTDNKNVQTRLSEFKRDILTVPNTINLFVLFNRLIEKKEHISIVVDEYGGLDGIITMEDVIETFLGLEIMDESDQVIDMQKYAKQKWIQKNTK